MNCNNPTIAVRLAGVNPKTGSAYKPYIFHRFRSDEDFVRTYWDYKSRLPKVPLKQVDLFSSDRDQLIQPPEVLVLPCGKCDLCIRTYKRNWACRCICESQVSHGGIFLTLTCSDDSQLRTFPDNNLIHKPFQDFVKRLRHPSNADDIIWLSDNHKIRYYMCGEYGTISHRAHYHVVLFGVDFRDKYQVGYSKSGLPLYSAPVLDRCRYVDGVEVFGKVSNFASLTPADICYTVGYVDKKLFDPDRRLIAFSENSVCSNVPQTPVNIGSNPLSCLSVSGVKNVVKFGRENPPYVKMSRRPGIGYDWLKQYHGDVWKFYNDEVLLSDCVYASLCGAKYFPPRYFFDKATFDDGINTPLLSDRQKSIILSDRRGRVSKVCSSPAAMLEDLQRTHDKCVIYRQRQAARCVRESFADG